MGLPDPFDYIHLRCVLTCFDDHRTVILKSSENLSPGGWVELSDPVLYPRSHDRTFQGSNLERMFRSLHQTMVAMGRSFEAAQNYKEWLIQAEFVDVVEEVAPWPGNVDQPPLLTGRREARSGVLSGNPWPTDPRFKELGLWVMNYQYRGLRGLC